MTETNTTLMINVEKQTIVGGNGYDALRFNYEYIDDSITHWSKNFTGQRLNGYELKVDRELTEVSDINLNQMPGFKLTWDYDSEIEHEAKFSIDNNNKQFVRLV